MHQPIRLGDDCDLCGEPISEHAWITWVDIFGENAVYVCPEDPEEYPDNR